MRDLTCRCLSSLQFDSEGGFEDPFLSRHWRGRINLTHDEQEMLYEAGSTVMDVSEIKDRTLEDVFFRDDLLEEGREVTKRPPEDKSRNKTER